MQCPQCQAALPHSARFCPQCGSPLTDTEDLRRHCLADDKIKIVEDATR